jgi:hypothetical protein
VPRTEMADGERVRDAEGRADHEHLLTDLHLVGVAELTGFTPSGTRCTCSSATSAPGSEAMTSAATGS